jgi:CBS domain-containing protein
MFTELENLSSSRVARAMKPPVVQLSANQTMEEAAAVLQSHGVNFAPVTNEQGRCVGMLTASDFLKHVSPPRRNGADPHCHDLVRESLGALEIVHAGAESVRCFMTAAVQSIGEEASLLDAARQMALGRLHRLPVIGADGRVTGIITAGDILGRMVESADGT